MFIFDKHPVQHNIPWLAIVCLTSLVACSGDDNSYFPLSEGRTWHYDISRTTMDGTFQQKQIFHSLPGIEWQSGTAVPLVSAGGAHYLYQENEQGTELVAVKARDANEYTIADEAFRLLPDEITPGATWRQSEHTQVLENTGSPWETLFRIVEPVSIEYVVESNDASIRVAAGEFRDCIKVLGHGEANVDVGNYIGRTLITIEIENWYAKGVGLVRSTRREITTSEALDYGELRYELEEISH